MKIKHYLSSPFTALYRWLVGYRPFGGDCKVVETSRYTHATDSTGARVYMSKPSWAAGLTVTTHAVRTGDDYIGITLFEGTRKVAEFTAAVTDVKAVAATLASACMKAQPRTGREMAPTNWQCMDETVGCHKDNAQYEASLFNGI